MRKDFTPSVSRKLAQRSGYICSYPSCERVTIAANEEGADKTSSVGMACHIYAASDGINAKRINSVMTDDQLSDISNGIWMCYTHGKLIDTDQSRFSATQLKEWKRINEAIASLRQETGLDYKAARKSIGLSKLIENEIDLPIEFAINQQVGEALHDSCLPIAWGQDVTETVRDLLIEHIRNAYVHGKAEKCTLRISPTEILVIDDGGEFDVRSLCKLDGVRGGALAIRRLVDHFGERMFLTSIRDAGKNILKIGVPKTTDEIINSTPCVVQFDIHSLHEGDFKYKIKQSCNEIFIILPEYFGLSDIEFISHNHPALLIESRCLVFVLRFTSTHVKEILTDRFPNCQIMVLNEVV